MVAAVQNSGVKEIINEIVLEKKKKLATFIVCRQFRRISLNDKDRQRGYYVGCFTTTCFEEVGFFLFYSVNICWSRGERTDGALSGPFSSFSRTSQSRP